jgi:hypothetical protein
MIPMPRPFNRMMAACPSVYLPSLQGVVPVVTQGTGRQTWPQPPLLPRGVNPTVSAPQVYAHVRDD